MFYKDTKFTPNPELDKELIIIALQALYWEVPTLDPKHTDIQQERINKQIELVKQLIK